MAVRDRNLFAWQAYVITMSFVSVGLLLLSFFLWRTWADLQKRYTDLQEQQNTRQTEYQLASDRINRLRSMFGKGEWSQGDLDSMKEKFAQDELLGEIEAEFEQKMNLFAPGDSISKNLITLPDYLLDTIRIRNAQIDEARQREKELQKQSSDIIQSETKARQDAVAAQKKAEADLEAARQQHATAVAQLNAEKQETFNKYDTYRADMESRVSKLTAVKNKLEEDNRIQAETIAKQTEIIQNYTKPDFAAPQGEILRVAQGGTLVWVNLGSRDNVRIGVPFSVIDESEINITNAKPKANIVITEVVAENMSRAEVQNYDARKTLVPGDKIYSPAWRPGAPVGFALVGALDMNGDLKDDADQVRELIRRAGGKIDAQINSKGVRDDTLPGMSPSTTFLVVGTDVMISGNGDLRADQQQRAAEYAKFRSEALSKGLIEISLDKLLGYLKTDANSRTVPLGDRIRGSDFPIGESRRPPVSTGTVSEVFQKRSPRQ